MITMKDKLDAIYNIVKKNDDDNDNRLICLLAIIGGIVVVALIAYAVYRFLTPDYFEDYDDDDDFDDDFDDDWDDEDEETEAAGRKPWTCSLRTNSSWKTA